jgi:TPR repeat protein
MEHADKFFESLRHESTNNDALFEADADPERLRQLSELSRANPAEAFTQFLALAEGGSVWSMLRVARAYQLGRGAPLDLARAEEWYWKASEHGSDLGLLQAGYWAFKNGDLARAKFIFGVGADRGLTSAMRYLAWMELTVTKTEQARSRARALYEQAIALGDLRARVQFVRAMAHGQFGLRLVPTGMRKLFSLAKDVSAQIDAMSSSRTAT